MSQLHWILPPFFFIFFQNQQFVIQLVIFPKFSTRLIHENGIWFNENPPPICFKMSTANRAAPRVDVPATRLGAPDTPGGNDPQRRRDSADGNGGLPYKYICIYNCIYIYILLYIYNCIYIIVYIYKYVWKSPPEKNTSPTKRTKQ